MKCSFCQSENPPDSKSCGHCGAPLASSGETLDNPTQTYRPALHDDAIGVVIAGKYKLLEELGSGGMGVVYLAEQTEPVRRRVALKIIKLGMDTKQVVARFESERQALAVMDHPNIARVFDAGATDTGRPYFVMELVRGVPLTEYCDRHRLTTPERLELFVPVCHAVQHAHQKGVIHRDLKPSNILVTVQDDRPVPKIIDFGIAKAIEHRLTMRTLFTEQGQLIGTPEYMSPEQAEMSGLDVDTRGDIYSLGVILYELLVGELPFDTERLRSGGFGEVQRIIREVEPPRASTRLSTLKDTQAEIAEKRKTDPGSLLRQLRGDLDWITMKAMAKDRIRRYASASELAAEVERHLRHEPVLAGPPSTLYRISKYVKRHKVGVTAAVVVLMAIIAGITGTTVGLLKARRAEQRAVKEARNTKQVSDFLVAAFQVSDPSESKGNTITAREILDRGAENIEKDLADQPLNQARLMNTIGEVFMNLGLYDKADSILNKALKIRREKLGGRSLEVAESIHDVGDLYRRQGKYAESATFYNDALAISEEKLGKNHRQVANILHSLGILYDTEGKYDQAESLFRRSLAIREKTLGPDQPDVASSLNSLAIVLWNEGKYTEAEPLFKRALAAKEKALGPDHPDVANTLTNLAILYKSQRKYKEAEPLLLRALAISEKVFGPDHPEVGSSLNNMATFYEEQGRSQEAESCYERVLAIWEKTLGPDHSDVGIVLHNMANLFRNQGKWKEAEPLYERSLKTWEKSLGPKHPYVAISLRERAALYRETGRLAEAESLYKRAAAIQEEALGPDHLDLAMTLEEYAALLRKVKREKEAETVAARAKAIRDKNPQPKE